MLTPGSSLNGAGDGLSLSDAGCCCDGEGGDGAVAAAVRAAPAVVTGGRTLLPQSRLAVPG